jgi:FixJ family two-component response regulator
LPQAPVIAVIDDDASIRGALKGLLSSLGFVVQLFASAEDFLQAPCTSETACLIVDVHMPGMSGIELQRRLIAQDQHTPIIFITAFPEEGIRARALEAGAVGFLSKPFEEQVLLERLDEALKRDGGCGMVG